jgi:hypothetical protein
MKKAVVFLALAGALAYGMFTYHFILMDASFRVLKKADPTLEDTFIDARGANQTKLVLNPALLRAGIKEILREAGN